MFDHDPLLMNDAERKLFEATKAFVLKACPKLSDEQMAQVTGRVYAQMRFVTKIAAGHRPTDPHSPGSERQNEGRR